MQQEQKLDSSSNSGNKKNKKKRKKRQKAKQQKQEQKQLVRNGVIMDEGIDTEVYAMMIPVDEIVTEKNQDISNP